MLTPDPSKGQGQPDSGQPAIAAQIFGRLRHFRANGVNRESGAFYVRASLPLSETERPCHPWAA